MPFARAYWFAIVLKDQTIEHDSLAAELLFVMAISWKRYIASFCEGRVNLGVVEVTSALAFAKLSMIPFAFFVCLVTLWTRARVAHVHTYTYMVFNKDKTATVSRQFFYLVVVIFRTIRWSVLLVAAAAWRRVEYGDVGGYHGTELININCMYEMYVWM